MLHEVLQMTRPWLVYWCEMWEEGVKERERAMALSQGARHWSGRKRRADRWDDWDCV